MNPPDNEQDPQAAVTAIHAALPATTQCDECGAPVEEEQRYCVVCGAHRRHVADPASRYLSELSARARTSRVTAVARTTRRPAQRGRGLGLAVALALVPVAAAVGVVAERSSNNGDAKLIQALTREQSAASANAGTAASSSGASTGGTAASANAGTATHARRTSSTRTHHAKKASHHARTAKQASSSIPGGVAISTAPPTQAQKQQGAQATQKVQKSKGTSYVNGQKSLPGTVVVP